MLGWIAAAFAQEDAAPDDDVEVVTVEGEKVRDTATERTLDRATVAAFPARSADELLRAMPGLHLSAHGGNGKAFQFLLRGFDAEHGSDLAVSVEGVPLNEPSNVHGQGYLDLHFLPAVLVDGLDLVKGSYRPSDGDFAITGAADYRVGLAREGLLLESSTGTDRSARGTAAWRPDGGGPGTFLVGEGEGAIGVGEGRRYSQVRAAAGIDGELGAVKAGAMAFAYSGAFESPGVLRIDDLDAGELGFYDAYRVAGAGASSRVLALGTLAADPGNTGFSAVGWAGARALRLDQNFSGWLLDGVHGDGTRQAEDAGDAGARVEVHRLVDLLGSTSALRAGADVRLTALTETEQGIWPSGRPWQDRLDADVRQTDLAAWSEARMVAGPVSVVPGIRVDRLDLGLRERLEPAPDSGGYAVVADPTWAHSGATVVSPKLRGSVELADPVTLFAAYGRGFRSPDARGVADGDLAPVMQSDSAETGLSVDPVDTVRLSATAFEIVVANELVFDHLAGRFLSAGRTRRLGVESVADWRPREWLHVQGDLTYTDGRFTADDLPIPYAPRWQGAVGVFAEGAPVARGDLSAGVRVWALGPRPLPSGFASRPAVVGTVTSALGWDRFSVGVDVDDLFLDQWRDGEFVYPSWFDPSGPRSELKVLHVTAGDPFAVRLVLAIRG